VIVERIKSGAYLVTIGRIEPIVYTVELDCMGSGFGWRVRSKFDNVFRPRLKSALGYLKEQHKAALLAESSLPSNLANRTPVHVSGSLCV